MNRKYEAVIFDLDGVICHTDQYHYLAWKAIADQLGIYFDQTINNRLRGVSRLDSLDIILETYDQPISPQEKEALATQKNQHYRTLLEKMSPADLDAQVKHTLDVLRQKGYVLAIGSSSRNAPLILDKIGLGTYFDAVSDGNNIQRSKPDPQVFEIAAQMLGVAPLRCVVVEDALAGVQAAHACGMLCIAIGDAAKENVADIDIQTMPELLDHL